MASEDYERLTADGMALAERVRNHCAEVGRDVTVGIVPGRNSSRFTVTERGRGKVPIVTWAPAWDGWQEKAEQDCVKAGLLPTESEDEVPAPTREEVERSNALRTKLRTLKEAAGGPQRLVALAVKIMEERGSEPFGGWAAKSTPQVIAEIQLTKFFDPNPPSMLTRNLDKWDGVLEEIEARLRRPAVEDTPAPAPVSAPDLSAINASSEAERVREQLAAADDRAKDEERRRTEAERELQEMREELRRVQEAASTALAEVVPAEAAGGSAELDSLRPMPDLGPHADYPPMARVIVAHEMPDSISSEVRRRYADQLLRSLDRNDPGIDHEQVMRRLDAIAGLPAAASA